MKICVVNASNTAISIINDEYFNFKGYTSFDDGRWRSYQSWTAALETEFFTYNGKNFHECYKYDAVIVLVDHNIHLVKPFIQKLKLMGKKVAVGYHEGYHMLDSCAWNEMKSLKELAKLCDFYINVNPPFHVVLEGFMDCPIVSIATTAPLDKWKFDPVVPDRQGIIVLTRTFNQSFLKRNTFAALSVASKFAKENKTFVTWINEDGPTAEYVVKEFFGDIVRVYPRQSVYVKWLSLISMHKVAIQMDASNSTGQVVLDCALANTPYWGGLCDYSQFFGVDNDTNEFVDDIKGDKHNNFMFHMNWLYHQRVDFWDHRLTRFKPIGFETTKQQLLEAFK